MANVPQRAFGKIVNSVSSGISAIQRSGGNSTFYPTTLGQQKSFKAGWLRKLGGVVKSWHRRWFTIKGDQLYYFSSEDESKSPLGSIFLPGFRVNELSFNINEPDKFVFEIIPGGDRVTHSDIYTVCANTDEERKDWVRVIRQVMYADKGGAIFGQALEETMVYESRLGNRKVPEIVLMCIEFLTDTGLEVEGLFRLPGRTSHVKDLRELFDCGERPTFRPEESDVHTVASLLKGYLRDLPEPLIPAQFFDKARKITTVDLHEDRPMAVRRMCDLMNNIPMVNYNLLQYLSKFLKKVASCKAVNKMSAENLGTVFNHSVIRPEIDDPAVLMGTAKVRSQIVVFLIQDYDSIFKKEYASDGSVISVDTLISFEQTDDANKSGQTIMPSGICQDLQGLDFSVSEGLEVLQQPSLLHSISEDSASYNNNNLVATYSDENIAVDPCALPVQPDPASEGDLTQLVSDSHQTEEISAKSKPCLQSENQGSHEEEKPAQSKVNYRVKKTQSFSNRGGIIRKSDECPEPPPRPSKRFTVSKQAAKDSEITQPVLPDEAPGHDEVCDSICDATEPAQSTPLQDMHHTPSQTSLEVLSVLSSNDDGSNEEPAVVPSERSDEEEESTPPLIMNTEVYCTTEQLSVDDSHIDHLLAAELTNAPVNDLLSHSESLHRVVLNLRSKVNQLEAEKRDMKMRHKDRVTELAKKLDVEKASTGEAVDLIVKLKSDIQKYQMNFGPLE